MRLYNRFDADHEVACRIAGERDFVTLYNISCGGCMVETSSPLAEVGAKVLVQLNDYTEITGVIVWRHEKNAGVKFDAVLMPNTLQNIGFAISSENFDEDDPRDRFGIPLVDRANHRDAIYQQPANPSFSDFTAAQEIACAKNTASANDEEDTTFGEAYCEEDIEADDDPVRHDSYADLRDLRNVRGASSSYGGRRYSSC